MYKENNIFLNIRAVPLELNKLLKSTLLLHFVKHVKYHDRIYQNLSKMMFHLEFTHRLRLIQALHSSPHKHRRQHYYDLLLSFALRRRTAKSRGTSGAPSFTIPSER